AGTANLTSGSMNITGGVVHVINDPNLGTAGNIINLNGGTLRLSQTDVASISQEFGFLGSGINGAGRTIAVGPGGGTIEVTARSTSNAAWAITQQNSITGAAGSTLTKAGYGDLFVMNLLDGVNSYQGNLA